MQFAASQTRTCYPKYFTLWAGSGFPAGQVQGQLGAEEAVFAPIDTVSDASGELVDDEGGAAAAWC